MQIYDILKLRELVTDFHNVTGIMLSVYDNQYNLICSAADALCGFCREIRKNSALECECIKSDVTALKRSEEIRDTYIYHCHMQLLEVAMPIIHNNVVTGFLLFGQLCDHTNKAVLKRAVCETAKKHKLDYENLCNELDKLKCPSNDFIFSISRIAKMVANHIWFDNAIGFSNNLLIYNVEKYINDHIRENLSVSQICSIFNISHTALYNLSKKHFKCSISEYIHIQKINVIKSYLSDSDYTLSDIAKAMSFTDVNYFIRFFKKKSWDHPETVPTGFTEL